LVDFIDWTPFFQSWELFGKYPAILKDDVVGEQASALFADAQTMLHQIVTEKWFTAKGILGIFPANTINDDDIALTTDNGQQTTFLTLRQQSQKNRWRA
jgi:5-methyltetrahydrofolate--homocysteine methyltransferase